MVPVVIPYSRLLRLTG